VSWRIEIPSESIDTVVRARVQRCEVGGTMNDIKNSKDSTEVLRYWEGPVASEDESVVGYLEMTGYAGAVMPF
jgi:predicted secreted hydrolase